MIIIIVLSFFTGLVSALLIAKYGIKLGLADVPNIRSAHSRTTPRGGGIGIPIAAALAVLLAADSLYIIAGIALVLSMFGFIDDRRDLPVRFRFVIQFLLSLVLVPACKSDFFPLIRETWGLWALFLFILLTAVYITATTNFFNFMDGINGISGFMTVISFALLGIYTFYYKNAPDFSLFSAAVIFSALGFLFLNFPGARVFMGDVGSIFIGNLYAASVVMQSSGIKEFLLLTLFQSTLYIDCISTIIMRFLNKENVLEAHKKHLYQKFVHELKWSHTRVTLLYSAIQVSAGAAALWLYRYDTFYLVVLWLVLIAFYWLTRFKMKLTG